MGPRHEQLISSPNIYVFGRKNYRFINLIDHFDIYIYRQSTNWVYIYITWILQGPCWSISRSMQYLPRYLGSQPTMHPRFMNIDKRCLYNNRRSEKDTEWNVIYLRFWWWNILNFFICQWLIEKSQKRLTKTASFFV